MPPTGCQFKADIPRYYSSPLNALVKWAGVLINNLWPSVALKKKSHNQTLDNRILLGFKPALLWCATLVHLHPLCRVFEADVHNKPFMPKQLPPCGRRKIDKMKAAVVGDEGKASEALRYGAAAASSPSHY